MAGIEIDKKDLKRAARKAKFREAFSKFKKKVQDGADWVMDNPEKTLAITAVAGTIGGAGAKIAKARHKSKVLSEERELKELYVYDNRLGHYWKVRRRLTNNEWLEIDRRKRNGERMADILSDLRLL